MENMGKNFAINLNVNISFVTRFLGALIGLCIFMAFVRGFYIYTTGNNTEDSLLMKFNMDFEQTLPTYVSTINLFIASALLALVSKFKRSIQDKYWLHWSILSFGFLFLSIDESISLHELLVDSVILDLFNISEQFHIGSSILILSCAVISILFFSKFVLHLPNKTKVRFIISGVIFVFGAAGMEAIGGYILSDGYQKVAYNIGVIIEESLEMTGVLLFIRAVLYYIKENLLEITPLFSKASEIPTEIPHSNKTRVAVQEEQLVQGS
ncbi:hypothetical protein DXT99_09780 [Pontibacter diazotrophicus]|uniref:DUF998 domain-containing protein n=1 Tax=Pontibacter diazotrophicus TaxID=1400979 RepID=A0A3D8LD72_9BACT|nr:hypothetical protein [Pontibacter diazotrophicus]RDV15340.1 hypothetical protein DXT99_09780 [Pontibacter diazotrophicus]